MPLSKTAAKMRIAELAKIHIAKKQLGLDDDTYRDVLRNVCGVESSADLDSQGRFKLLKHFGSKGFQPRRKSSGNSRQLDPKSSKVWSLWYQLRDAGRIRLATAKTLRTEVKNLTGCDDLRFCDEAQKSHVIECLKKWLSRA